MSLDLGLFERSSGFGKCNTSLLHDNEYVHLLKQCNENVLHIYRAQLSVDTEIQEICSIDCRRLFEMLKFEIRVNSIIFSAIKKRKIKSINFTKILMKMRRHTVPISFIVK